MYEINVQVITNEEGLFLQCDIVSDGWGNPAKSFVNDFKKIVIERYPLVNMPEFEKQISTIYTECKKLCDVSGEEINRVLLKLPVTPHLLINVFGALSVMCKEANEAHIRYIYANSYLNEEEYKVLSDQWAISAKKGLSIFNREYVISIEDLIEKVLKVRDFPPAYQKALSKLSKANQLAREGGKYFHQMLTSNERLHFLIENKKHQPIVFVLSKDNIWAKTCPEIVLLEIANDFLKEGQGLELTYVLNTIGLSGVTHHYARMCLGKKAHDREEYCSYHTEYRFLLYAKFTLKSNGRMHITNNKQNPIYQEKYQSGKQLHSIFLAELTHMMNLMGLSFCKTMHNPHEEIIFDLKSSQTLKDWKVHYNASYVASLLQLKNKYRFFTCKADRAVATELSLMDLPIEIINSIVKFSLPSFPFTQKEAHDLIHLKP